MEDKILEQANHFRYPDYGVIFLDESDSEVKIHKNSTTCAALLGEHLKKNLQRIHELCQVMAICALLHASECWTVRKRHMQK
jgi:hypothetical protein